MKGQRRVPSPAPREVIARVSGLPASRLDDACPLSEIARDSFDRVELLLALEEECGLRLDVTPDRLREITTLGELLGLLRPR